MCMFKVISLRQKWLAYSFTLAGGWMEKSEHSKQGIVLIHLINRSEAVGKYLNLIYFTKWWILVPWFTFSFSGCSRKGMLYWMPHMTSDSNIMSEKRWTSKRYFYFPLALYLESRGTMPHSNNILFVQIISRIPLFQWLRRAQWHILFNIVTGVKAHFFKAGLIFRIPCS